MQVPNDGADKMVTIFVLKVYPIDICTSALTVNINATSPCPTVVPALCWLRTWSARRVQQLDPACHLRTYIYVIKILGPKTGLMHKQKIRTPD